MSVRIVLLLGVCLLLAGCALSGSESGETLEAGTNTLYVNGRIYTLDESAPWASAMAVRNGRIVAIGDRSGVATALADSGGTSRTVDLDGRMVMPGIQDMHAHPMDGGIKSVFECVFPATLTTQEILVAVRDCAESQPAGTWIQGGQWGTTILESDMPPTAELLDEVSTEHPIFLLDWSVHNGWLNTAALERVGITDVTPNPLGGEIVRDRQTGKATGILLDNAAYDARKVIPGYSLEQRQEALRYSIGAMLGFGVTSFRDAITNSENFAAYAALDAAGELPIRAQVSIPWKSSWSKSHSDELNAIATHVERNRPRLATSFAKIMLDGVPLTYTSAILEPYEPSEQYGDNHFGELMHEPQQLAVDVTQLDAAGLTVKMHATGDRAVRVALDAVAAARAANGNADTMHEVSHAEMIHPDDIPRFADLNVAAEMCPILWYPNPAVDTMRMTLGERAERMWAARTLREAGALVFYGSDWPAVVPDINPWPGIEAMVTRADPYNQRAGTLWPEQALDLAATLQVFTLNGATTGRQSELTGSLEVGKAADFIVLDRHLFEIPANQLSDTLVLHTFVDGREVYTASGYKPL